MTNITNKTNINIFIEKKISLHLSSLETKMIQRIQSVYLLVALLISSGVVYILNLWINIDGVEVFAFDLIKNKGVSLKGIPILFLVSSILSLVTIFKFKNRQTQFVLGRLNILINLIILGLLVVHLQSLSGETSVSEKGIGSILPLITIILLVMANRAIKKDEDLVKSVDRLR
jgi:hypothetical protein|tara:strand:- start:3724 stop:4242 length:519 start_codon:yes stop_codon:yes gene_type:complete